ncbi:GTPase HflX [Paracrocinitomix mangrovi]|uniref:GTPase HflX n=1 Tax=Paracrocinitomix mangrovi TaxID=2862509 RepID=UPI001C8CF4F9|nr:GTPase HflX [Paracrocinitomix mangrovi]UKN03826.1 GTPase HflX [Paracrocinitomix mangrovi]
MGEGLIYTDVKPEKVVLVGVITSDQTEEMANEYLDELEFLAETSGAETLKKFTQRIDQPNSKTYVGSGKIEEIRLYCLQNQIDTVIFDDELSPTQIRNIERILNIKILDRSNLILDIFAKRARTADAKTQVELAQYQYLLPRLTRLWTHLDRTKGGIGMRGPGETQIETDRRIIQQKIATLKEKLEKIDRQKSVQRGNRGQLVRVALVGYTNVGKSTIMNMLSKSEVFAENKLFATLDTTVRKVVIDNLPFLLSDTVGFIRKLPHQLIESFKSTLDEVREADVLIHVLDISHPNFEDHYRVVNETIAEIDEHQTDKPTLVVFNKVDAYNPKPEDIGFHPDGKDFALDALKKSWMAKLGKQNCIFISAQEKINIEEFKSRIYEEVKEIFQVRYPYHNFLY